MATAKMKTKEKHESQNCF